MPTCCRLLALLGVAWLVGCATVDQFGSRAAEYSRQVEAAHNEELLLNVLRAAYRQPMHFVSISSISGSASAGAEIGFSIPIGGSHGGSPGTTAPFIYSAAPKVSYVAGPTVVSVGVLNTQEFYQGLLTPLKEAEMALFIKQGIPKWLLLTMFVEEINVRGGSSPQSYTNNFHVGEDARPKYEGFKRELEYLLSTGLDIESSTRDVIIGPPMGVVEASNLKRVIEAKAQGLQVARYDIKTLCAPEEARCRESDKLTADERLAAGNRSFFYYLIKSSNVFAFCFKRKDQDGCTKPADVDEKRSDFPPAGLKAFDVETGLHYGFRPRSVEEIIYFLGEVVRYELSHAGRVEAMPGESSLGEGACQTAVRQGQR